MITPAILEQMTMMKNGRRTLTLGVPAPRAPYDRRMALTPEGASILVSQGIKVQIERDAGSTIHYDDNRYARAGAAIVTRVEALASDIIVYIGALTPVEAATIRPHAVLLTLFDSAVYQPATVNVLLERQITVFALNYITDQAGNRPVADILGEVDGRAAIAIGSSLLADPEYGKGILLGGVAGVNPCEVLILGSGMAAIAAARSAIGLGGIVRMFDNDPYSLRTAIALTGPGVIGSALHPRVIGTALRTADVVIVTPMKRCFCVDDTVIDEMKSGVVIFDLGARAGISGTFPTLRCIDMAVVSKHDKDMMAGTRTCYTNAAGAVPRTTAMAITNELIPILNRLTSGTGGVQNALKIDAGLREGAVLYRGRVVNRIVAESYGVKVIDINLLITFS